MAALKQLMEEMQDAHARELEKRDQESEAQVRMICGTKVRALSGTKVLIFESMEQTEAVEAVKAKLQVLKISNVSNFRC